MRLWLASALVVAPIHGYQEPQPCSNPCDGGNDSPPVTQSGTLPPGVCASITLVENPKDGEGSNNCTNTCTHCSQKIRVTACDPSLDYTFLIRYGAEPWGKYKGEVDQTYNLTALCAGGNSVQISVEDPQDVQVYYEQASLNCDCTTQ